MLLKNSYLILDTIPKKPINTVKLCIFSFEITKRNEMEVSDLINKNPDTEFWLATNDSSREAIKKAQKVGVSSIIGLPIDNNFIDNYLANNIPIVEEHSQIDKRLACNIAIVDDNIMNIKLLEEILSDIIVGDIKSYQKPELLLADMEDTKFDLFLLDILMPNMSGFELADKIKRSKLNSDTAIVFISAMIDTENKLNGYNHGAYSYIEKPYNIEVVKSQIYNLLKHISSKKTEDTSKENFVAMLTHDLKSPINAEINALELLMNKKFGIINDSQNEVIGCVLNSAKYMKNITDQILCHYKQKNGKVDLHKERVSLTELINNAIEEMKFLYEEKAQKINFNSKIKESYVYIDYVEIKRVVINLISNAIEYSPSNSEICITLSKNNDWYTFKIKDRGCGIEIDNKDKIFDEYISLAKRHKKIGFGLGLNICKIIVSAHGGTISIDSKPMHGTTIKFTLPVCK